MFSIADKKRAICTKRYITCTLVISLALACLIGTLIAPVAYAAEPGQVTLTINQVFVRVDGSVPPSEVFSYKFAPTTRNAPMPVGSNAEGYFFEIDGTTQADIGPISFTAAGVYAYTLSCITEDMPGYTIDRIEYNIVVYVTADLTAVVVVYIDDDAKVADISFEHTYKTPPKVPEVTPGNPGGGGGGTWNPGGGGGGTDTPEVTPEIPGGTETPEIITETPEVITEIPGTDTHTPDTVVNTPDGSEPNTPRGGTDKVVSPQTGDVSNPGLWKTLILISGVLLILITWIGWKTSHSDDDSNKEHGSAR